MVSSRSGWDWGLMKGTQHSTPMLGGKRATVSCYFGIFQAFSHEIVRKLLLFVGNFKPTSRLVMLGGWLNNFITFLNSQQMGRPVPTNV